MLSMLLVIYKTRDTSDHGNVSSLGSHTGDQVIPDEYPGKWNHDQRS